MTFKKRAKKYNKYTPKPYVFPEDFILIIDTREQRPLCQGVKGLVSVTDTVKHGDYTIKGFEDKFAIERKQITDFYSYIGKERKRTEKKIKALSQMDFAAIIIEAGIDDILFPQLYSQVSPEVARQFLVSVNVRYDIHTYLDRDRGNLERWMLDRAIKYFKVMRES